MMKSCSCRERDQDQRAQRKTIQEVSTQLVLIERRGQTPFRFGERSATRVALVNRKQLKGEHNE